MPTKTEPTRYRFYIDGKVYETQFQKLTSMELKSIAGIPLCDRLAPENVRSLLEQGVSIFLRDDEFIDLQGELKHFHSSPQAHD